MKKITYQLATQINRGTEAEPVMETVLAAASITCPDRKLEANLAMAKAEAYNGEVSVEDAGPDPEAGGDLEAQVAELKEALNMILTGYTGEEAADETGTA